MAANAQLGQRSGVPLDVRWGLFMALLLAVIAVIVLMMDRRPNALTTAQECGLLAQIAPSVAHDPLASQVGALLEDEPIECRAAFVRAGLPIAPVGPDGRPLGTYVRFGRAVVSHPDIVTMEVGRICGGLCGMGEWVTLNWRQGRWVVISREMAWIS